MDAVSELFLFGLRNRLEVQGHLNVWYAIQGYRVSQVTRARFEQRQVWG